MARILVTGIATLDIINQVSHYPDEDEELRAEAQYLRRGGNASNTASVLVQLGDRCRLACSLADDMGGRFIVDDLRRRGIEFDPGMILMNGATPTSYITLNRQNGSRTIVHYRDLPELGFHQFDTLVLNHDWFHFEARNCRETRRMMGKARQLGRPLSLEVEKQRPDLDQLFPLADVIMFSRAFAQQQGFDNAEQCLRHFAAQWPDKRLSCTWGGDGAWALQSGALMHSPAFPPQQLVDTIGAGDTFNAGLIHSLAQASSLPRALTDACRLAGRKCGQIGFDQLDTES